MAEMVRTRRRVLIPLAALAAGLVIVGAAYALTARTFTYSSPRTGYVRLGALAFADDEGGGTYGIVYSGGYLVTPNCMNAGLNLPAGALVKSVTFYYRSGASSDFAGSFFRKDLGSTTNHRLVFVNPSDNSNTLHAVTGTVATADQSVTNLGAYGIGVCPGSDGQFHGARVKYTYTSAGS